MANPRLKRQQSTISIYFEALSPRYFCCFGVCHAKTLGIFIIFFESISLILLAAFLFLQSAHYNAQEWASREVLIQVAAAILSILLCAATTGCLFVGVVYEKSAFILPYTLRQVVSIVLVYVLIALRPEYTCPGIPISVFLLVLLLVSLGTYRYLVDMENAGCRFFISEQMASSRTWSHSSPSRLFSHRSCPSATTPKLSKDANRPATIDFLFKPTAVYLGVLKAGVLVVAVWTFALLVSPRAVCWDEAAMRENAKIRALSYSPNASRAENGGVCVPTAVFGNVMCAGDSWDHQWWRAQISDPAAFCMGRRSTMTAMFLQLALAVLAAGGHFASLVCRAFAGYDPLDMVPAFFSICALSSVLIVQGMMAGGWDELWRMNKLPPPSAPFNHELLSVLLGVGVVVCAVDWLFCYFAYNGEQDRLEAAAKSAPLGSTGSDKEHDE